MKKAEKIVKKTKKSNSALSVFNLKGKSTSEINVPLWLKKIKPNMKLIAQYVRVYQGNQRQGTVSTKTRGEVKGSTRKIYRQKGTGGARHGSRKAPIFVGGGLVGGPKPKEYKYSLNKKQRNKVFSYAFAVAVKNNIVNLISSSVVDKIPPKTKEAGKFLQSMGYEKNERVLFILEVITDNFKRAFRNIPMVSYKDVKSLSAYDLLSFSRIFITEKAFEMILSSIKDHENK